MLKVGAYAFSHDVRGLPRSDIDGLVAAVRGQVIEWLRSKGASEEILKGEKSGFTLEGGAEARLLQAIAVSSIGGLESWQLVQAIPQGEFATEITIAHGDSEIVVYCTLEVGHTTTIIAPIEYAAHGPRVIRMLLNLVHPTRAYLES